MLRVMKSSGRVLATRANDGARGKRGRIELNILRREDDGDFVVRFEEFGNYGKSRWYADVLMTKEDIIEMNASAATFVQSDDLQSLPVFQASDAEEANAEEKGEDAEGADAADAKASASPSDSSSKQEKSSKDKKKNKSPAKSGFQKINTKAETPEQNASQQQQESKEKEEVEAK